jgi:hypothetical protein
LCLDVFSELAFSGNNPVNPVVTGLGCNWVVEASVQPTKGTSFFFSVFFRQTRFRTKVPADTSGVVTITYTTNPPLPTNIIDQFAYALIRLEGASTAGDDGKGAFRQTITANGQEIISDSPRVNLNVLPIITPSNLKLAAIAGQTTAGAVPNWTPEANYTELTDNGVNPTGFNGIALATLYAVPGNPDLSPSAVFSQLLQVGIVIASEIAAADTSWYIHDSAPIIFGLEFAPPPTNKAWGWFGVPAIGEGSEFEPEPKSWEATYWSPAEMAFNSPQWLQTYWTPAEIAFNEAEAVVLFNLYWTVQANMGLGYYAP